MKGLSLFYAIIASILLLSVSPATAQHDTEKCGYVKHTQHLNEQYPGYLEAIDRTLEAAKLRGETSRLGGNTNVYTIDVVVHIVYVTGDAAAQNLADSIIENQMNILNENFRHINPDAGNLRDEFNCVVGDPMIQFDLKQVIRVGTPSPIFDILNLTYDGIKDSNEGGSDAVDPSTTMNIWVAELFGGFVLGYAYPPAGLAHWPGGSSAPTEGVDGVLIDYRAFGSNNPASEGYPQAGYVVEGRTTVHEVGHYLGLRHVWGDGDCAEDDFVDDTPAMGENSQTSGCNPANNTCGAGTLGDLPDMWENYMDYSPEPCQVAFTVGQIDIMRGVLEGPRSGIVGTTTGATCELPLTGTFTGSTDVVEATTETYTLPATGNDYCWSVFGGTVASGDGTNAIQITWGSGTEGRICLAETDGDCTGNQVCIDVAISEGCSNPATGSISGDFTPDVSSMETYMIPSTSNTIEWEVTGGTVASGGGTNSINVNWGSGSSGTVCVTESDGDCTGNQVCENVTLSVVSGITEIAYNKGLSVYPNPATSFVRVVSNEVPQQVDLINILGATVASYDRLSTDNTIEFGNISDKIIFVRVQFEDGFALERIVVE